MPDRIFLSSIALILRGLLRMIDERLGNSALPPGCRVVLYSPGFIPIPNLKEYFRMTQKVEGVEIRGDIAGYVSAGAIAILNGAGHRMDPQPVLSTIAASQTGLADAYLAEDGRVVLVGDDAQLPGAPFEARFSAIETGEEDDLVITGTYLADQVGSVDGASIGAFSSASDLPPRAAPAA